MGKKRKNTIFCLQGENGSIEGDELISKHVTQYYKNLFGPSSNANIHLDSNCWDPGEKISKEENKELTKEFTMEEIKFAVFSMEKNTARGPDHLPIEFYQNCWNIISIDLLSMFNDFHHNNLDIGRFNME
jgi:hypothetical protein